MKIESVEFVENNKISSYKVKISGKDTLLISFNGSTRHENIGDCLLLLILFQAMKEKSEISLPSETPVSPVLLKNVYKLQEIFSRWFPDLNIVSIYCNTKEEGKANKNVMAFFSGGVDSFYTFLKNKNEITDLLLCIGLDIQLFEKDKAKESIRFFEKISKKYNQTLVVATTNIRELFTDFDVSIQTGAVLSGLALMTGNRKILVPATNSVEDLIPLGTHPLSDQLFSNGISEIEHHGAITRSEKIEYIAQYQYVLDSLRVCNSSDEFNCGKCEKCLRTMFALGVLDKTSVTLPSIFDNLHEIKKLKLYGNAQFIEWKVNLKFAQKHHQKILIKQAKRIVRNYEIRLWLKEGKRLLLRRK